jgi:hypothetical protein
MIVSQVGSGAQSALIGAPERMSIEAVLAAPNGGDAREFTDAFGHAALANRATALVLQHRMTLLGPHRQAGRRLTRR